MYRIIGIEIDVSKVKLNSGINCERNRNILFLNRKLLGLTREVSKIRGVNETWHKHRFEYADYENHIHFCLMDLWAELQTAEKLKNPCCGTGI